MQVAAKTKEEVIARLERAEHEIRSLKVRRIALFGSFARAEAHADSDVDLLVAFLPAGKTSTVSWSSPSCSSDFSVAR